MWCIKMRCQLPSVKTWGCRGLVGYRLTGQGLYAKACLKFMQWIAYTALGLFAVGEAGTGAMGHLPCKQVLSNCCKKGCCNFFCNKKIATSLLQKKALPFILQQKSRNTLTRSNGYSVTLGDLWLLVRLYK